MADKTALAKVVAVISMLPDVVKDRSIFSTLVELGCEFDEDMRLMYGQIIIYAPIHEKSIIKEFHRVPNALPILKRRL